MAQRTIYKRRISPHLPLAKLLLTLRQVSFSPFEFSPAGSHPLRLTHASPATVCSLPSSGPQTQFFAIMMVTTIWCWHCTICFCGKHGLSSSWESFFFARAHGRGSEGWLWPRQDRFSLNFVTNLHCHFTNSLYLFVSPLPHITCLTFWDGIWHLVHWRFYYWPWTSLLMWGHQCSCSSSCCTHGILQKGLALPPDTTKTHLQLKLDHSYISVFEFDK